MLKIVLCLVLGLSCSLAFDNSDEFINEINRKQNMWKAGRNFPKEMPASQLRGLLGGKSLPPEIMNTIPVKTHEITDDLPESFDARTQWPNCKTIKEVADQSACGASWAFAATLTISDRICIHTNGKLQPEISARNVLACNSLADGCGGGNPYLAYRQWVNKGLVTGGAYNSSVGCQPYPFPPCEHYKSQGSKPPCPSERYPTPKCIPRCDNSEIAYSKDIIYGKKTYILERDEKQIRAEIMKNGPVTSIFEAYSDFFHYKSGVYIRTVDSFVGFTAVRVIGWGVENNTKYWLAVNSWNEDWGDKGLFKIRRGVNECDFEFQVNTALPYTNKTRTM